MPAPDQQVLLDLACELHRLATGLKRDLRRNAYLPGLSDLRAMRPLQAMLTEALSAHVGHFLDRQTAVVDEIDGNCEMPGYL